MNEVTKIWPFDDEPSRRFPIYCRGNAGEIVPNAVTPLTSSIIVGHFGEAFADLFGSMGAFSDVELEEPAGAGGMFGAYLYLNLSLPRLLAARLPGLKVADIDQQLVGTSDAPPYRRQPGDRSGYRSARALVAMTRSMLRPVAIDLDGQRAATLSRRTDEHLDEASDEALIERASTYGPRFALHLRSLIQTTANGALPAAMLERLVARSNAADPGVVNRLLGGLGTIETAQPAVALWRLGGAVASSEPLSTLFDTGVVGLRARLDAHADDPDVTRFLDAFDAFLAVHGHRGPNEIELASPTWGTDPEIALAAIERLRLGARGGDPDDVHARLADERETSAAVVRRSLRRPMRPIFDRMLAAAATGAAGREMAKGTLVLDLHGIRLALNELAARLVARGAIPDPLAIFMVTLEELPELVEHPSTLASDIATRRALYDELNDLVPPFSFEGRQPDVSTWSRRGVETTATRARAGDVLTGIGVSSGRATGRARTVRDPADPRGLEPGDVLVAPITDPAWTPLFLAASAVVVDVGAFQSHAAIVARELGIPAVVSVAGASVRIPDGARIDVDGDRGTVHVLG